MSAEVFWWEPFPDDRIITDYFKTLITEFENGVEQRRNKWQRSKLTFQYRYNREEYNGFDDVVEFFSARKGSYENFYLPVWKWVAYLDATADSSSIYVTNRSLFTPTAGIRGNAIFFKQTSAPSNNEVITIDSFGATANLVYLDSSPTHSYLPETNVFVATKVRFLEDGLHQPFFSKKLNDITLSFVEDKL